MRAWYGGMMGLLVVRASDVPELSRSRAAAGLRVAIVADTGADRLVDAVMALAAAGAVVRRAEAAVAKRGEDPMPGVQRLVETAAELADRGQDVTVHAEIPLTGGLQDALDVLAHAPRSVAATFRVGGLAGELFPAPPALAGVICACRDRGLTFSLSAGLDRALRHNDHETGFAHHGVLNVLAACLVAGMGAAPAAVAERLATNDPVLLAEAVIAVSGTQRPLWTAYTATRVDDIVHDLTLFDVLSMERKGDAAGGPG
jgi:hypothetical protein